MSLHSKVLRARQDFYGPLHPQIQDSMVSVGLLTRAQRRMSAARERERESAERDRLCSARKGWGAYRAASEPQASALRVFTPISVTVRLSTDAACVRVSVCGTWVPSCGASVGPGLLVGVA